MNARAQSTIEWLLILVGALVILAVLVNFSSQQISFLQKQQSVQTARTSIDLLVDNINQVYTQGPGATKRILLAWPNGIDSANTGIFGNTIRVRVSDTDIVGESIPLLNGSLPLNGGTHSFLLRAYDGFVVVGDISIISSPSYLFAPLSWDENRLYFLTIQNLSDSPADVFFSLDWNHSLVNLGVLPLYSSVLGFSSFDINVDVNALSNSVGSYSGKILVSSIFSNKTESFSIPVSVEVFAGGSGTLDSFPNSLEIETFGSDVNSVSFQLCNISGNSIKEIGFSFYGSGAEQWMNGIDTIDELASQSCQTVVVSVYVPDSGSIGLYYVSLNVSDFSGVHHLTVPVTVWVRGMESAFRLDWGEASKGPYSIFGHKLLNVGSKSITIDEVTVGKWQECDSTHSHLTDIIVDDETVFSGSLDFNSTADILDTTIPVLTTLEDNELRFDGLINDDNESFQVLVSFSDGTSYLSSVFGYGCGPDFIPPADVSDLLAFSGSDPGKILLTFTYSGDDNFSGTATSASFRYKRNTVIDENNWVSSSVEPFSGPFLVGGSQGSFLVSDYRVGIPFNFAVKFLDENSNSGNVSNSPQTKPWNEFNYVLDDFNFSYFAPSDPWDDIIGGEGEPIYDNDINLFVVHGLQAGAGSSRQIAMRVKEDSNSSNVWIGVLDFNQTHLNRIRIWYPAGGLSGVPVTTPQFDGSASLALTGTIDLLSSSLIPSDYRYNGLNITMGSDNTFYLDILNGFTDMNLAFDIDWKGEGFIDDINGGYGKA